MESKNNRFKIIEILYYDDCSKTPYIVIHINCFGTERVVEALCKDIKMPYEENGSTWLQLSNKQVITLKENITLSTPIKLGVSSDIESKYLNKIDELEDEAIEMDSTLVGGILCDMLEELGYDKIVSKFKSLDRWHIYK